MSVLYCADLCRNHGGDLATARAMISAAAAAGASIIKLQADDGLENHHEDLFRDIHDAGCLSALTVRSANDCEAPADILKVGSGECLNRDLIQAVVQSGKLWVISTGGTTGKQFRIILSSVSASCLAVCECTSAYPSYSSELRLGVLLDPVWGLAPKGWSDHIRSIAPALGAIALGCSYVEKHVSLTPQAPGENHACSLDPNEFAVMTNYGDQITAGLRNSAKTPLQREFSTGKLRSYRRLYGA